MKDLGNKNCPLHLSSYSRLIKLVLSYRFLIYAFHYQLMGCCFSKAECSLLVHILIVEGEVYASHYQTLCVVIRLVGCATWTKQQTMHIVVQLNVSAANEFGYMLEADLRYPKPLFDHHSDF